MHTSNHVVVGGGITGLTLAWQLLKHYGNQIHITLLEKNAYFGGWLQTDRYGDFLFERGPHSCRAHSGGEAVLELIETLELSEQLLHAHKHANKRYLYMNKQLLSVPNTPFQCLLSPLTRSTLLSLLTEWTVPSRYLKKPEANHTFEEEKEETVHDWTTRRLGKKIAERFMDPLMRGIFAGDSRILSMEACLPTLIAHEKTYGSLTRALLTSLFQKNNTPSTHSPSTYSPWVRAMLPRGLFTLRKGWGQLIERLIDRLSQATTLRTQVELISIHPRFHSLPHQPIELLLKGGERLEADAVYLTTPAHVSAYILKQSAPEAATALSSIPFAHVTVAHVGFHRSVLPYRGFGHLVPTWEDAELLGMVWDSSLFPEQNGYPDQTRLTVMLHGGTKNVEKKVHEALTNHLGITKKPDILQFHFLPQAIPQYTLGHLSRVEQARKALQQRMPQVKLLGNSFDGISLSASISSAHSYCFQTRFPL